MKQYIIALSLLMGSFGQSHANLKKKAEELKILTEEIKKKVQKQNNALNKNQNAPASDAIQNGCPNVINGQVLKGLKPQLDFLQPRFKKMTISTDNTQNKSKTKVTLIAKLAPDEKGDYPSLKGIQDNTTLQLQPADMDATQQIPRCIYKAPQAREQYFILVKQIMLEQ